MISNAKGSMLLQMILGLSMSAAMATQMFSLNNQMHANFSKIQLKEAIIFELNRGIGPTSMFQLLMDEQMRRASLRVAKHLF